MMGDNNKPIRLENATIEIEGEVPMVDRDGDTLDASEVDLSGISGEVTFEHVEGTEKLKDLLYEMIETRSVSFRGPHGEGCPRCGGEMQITDLPHVFTVSRDKQLSGLECKECGAYVMVRL